ncbi:hypothetical protein ABT364_02650 [Massilia sp. SR12]
MQIYAEVGASYDLSHKLLKPLLQRLNALGKNIPFLAEKLKVIDFEITYIISATRKTDNMYTKGPTFSRKRSCVEFVIFVPYREIADFSERIEFVIDHVGAGIKCIFEKYGIDSVGVDRCVEEVISLAKQRPLEYQSPP